MIAAGSAHCGPCREHRDSTSRRPATIVLVGIIALLFEIISAPALGANANLTSVVVRGSSVYAAPELYDAYREQLGRPIDRVGARAIVTAVVAKYEGDGYSRPQVRVDDALIEIGVLRLDVLEPRIAAVKISGNPGPHLQRLESLGLQLRADGLVRQSTLQTTLRRMRELPGLTLSASTARDDVEPNRLTLDLDTDFEPMTGAVRLSNRGTDEAGPYFVMGQVVANGLFAGQTNLGVLFGAATDYDEYHGLGLLANVGVGNAGMRTSVTGFRSRSNPREPQLDRDDEFLRDRITLAVTRPLARDSRVSITLSAGLDLDDLEILRSGSRLRDERLRMIEFSSSLRWRGGTRTQYAALLELVQGLDGLGSGLAAADLVVDPRRADFSLTRLSLTRLTRLGETWSVRLDAFAQQSAYVLPYGQRFKIGGDRLGRGFEIAEIAGDQGLGAKVELRRRLERSPAALGRASLYTFYDLGATWKQDVPGRESAATAGFGFATQNGPLSASIELAQPLTHPDVEGHKSLALFGELTIGF